MIMWMGSSVVGLGIRHTQLSGKIMMMMMMMTMTIKMIMWMGSWVVGLVGTGQLIDEPRLSRAAAL